LCEKCGEPVVSFLKEVKVVGKGIKFLNENPLKFNLGDFLIY